ncbi:hypothetical protein [Herbaspirillum sp. RV1423]|uniref:hypothetical protein n=1 Tax=Herbaspirillum sp. RV1423 TaxID=1443993 RepID=UPI0012DD8D69|nr:hypothetical protein [Herbaspirillum sp. RV1423]
MKISLFHIITFSLILTAIAMVFTGRDLGPFAPIFVSGGLYIALFSMIAQVVYWISVGIQRLANGPAR